jgi:serine/threonine protein kinase
LLKPLGRGGMGMVYLARHRKLNREVDIKPVYQGQDFDEWLHLLKTERSDSESKNIYYALQALNDPKRSKELAEAVLERCRENTSVAMTYLWLLIANPKENVPLIIKFWMTPNLVIEEPNLRNV